ncbi:MAG: transposase, partial [Ignavibacteria bacterium]
MKYQRSSVDRVSRLTAHIVWSTKYRYSVLEGDIKIRCRTIIKQICESEDVVILKGRSSRKLEQEFPELGKRYWGRHFWAIGYGCWSTGNIT